jgi:hypothetical protein
VKFIVLLLNRERAIIIVLIAFALPRYNNVIAPEVLEVAFEVIVVEKPARAGFSFCTLMQQNYVFTVPASAAPRSLDSLRSRYLALLPHPSQSHAVNGA